MIHLDFVSDGGRRYEFVTNSDNFYMYKEEYEKAPFPGLYRRCMVEIWRGNPYQLICLLEPEWDDLRDKVMLQVNGG